MGAVCTGVDESEEDVYTPYTNCSKRKNTAVNVDDITHNSSMEDFMSRHRMRIHCNTDPIARSSIFTEIAEEFKQEFDREIPRDILYNYYNCS